MTVNVLKLQNTVGDNNETITNEIQLGVLQTREESWSPGITRPHLQSLDLETPES